ncbi:MAG: ThiF family adenylyltransferase, partial [bacterium]|nr:ThiF family adenylyltransferase [bacterium]
MSIIQDFLRYNRQMMLPEIGDSGQEKLKKARVLVIGAGGLGCPILQYIATAGVGTIGIVDFDTIELHNLHRQILYTEKHVGQSKAITAKSVLEILNP